MKTKAVFVVLIGIGLCLTASVACADTIQYFIGVDDYGSLSINGTLLATFDSGGAGTTAPVAVTLPAGWYDITIDYKNIGWASIGIQDRAWTWCLKLTCVRKTALGNGSAA